MEIVPKKEKVVNLAEIKGDNTLLTPVQLLDIIKKDLEGLPHASGMYAIIIETEGKNKTLSTYRAGLEIDFEHVMLSQKLFELQIKRYLDSDDE